MENQFFVIEKYAGLGGSSLIALFSIVGSIFVGLALP